jgi:hypothetical protein
MRPMIIELSPGKQIIITTDPRTPGITWLQLCVNGGSLGLQIDKKTAVKVRNALFNAIAG